VRGAAQVDAGLVQVDGTLVVGERAPSTTKLVATPWCWCSPLRAIGANDTQPRNWPVVLS